MSLYLAKRPTTNSRFYVELRNRCMLLMMLDGESMADLGSRYGMSASSVRINIWRMIRLADQELYEDGVRSGWGGTHATPSLSWVRVHKERILSGLGWPTFIEFNVLDPVG